LLLLRLRLLALLLLLLTWWLLLSASLGGQEVTNGANCYWIVVHVRCCDVLDLFWL
jgi:hypothetical protein